MSARGPVRVKVCGITRERDAEWAARCGADAIGLVFAESPRRVRVGDARRIAAAAGPLVTTVGVFVDMPASRVAAAARRAGLQAVQLHGDESPSEARRLMREFRVIKAFRVATAADVRKAADYPCDALLFDAFCDGARGGTGRTFDWRLLGRMAAARVVIVSGGLGPDNVRLAVARTRPYAVDASSRLERSAGIKDPGKVEEFIRNAKR